MKRLKYTTEDALSIARSHNGQLLSKLDKIKSVTKLRWKCGQCGNEWESQYGHNFMMSPRIVKNAGKWCPICVRI